MNTSNITSETTIDVSGNPVIVIRKKRGVLSVEEIRREAMKCGQGYYMMVMKCVDEDMSQYYDDDLKGDAVELYEADTFLQNMNRMVIK